MSPHPQAHDGWGTAISATLHCLTGCALVSIPGAMDAGVASAVFWLSLAGALAIAFVVTVPVDHWLIARGRGRAVVPHAAHR